MPISTPSHPDHYPTTIAILADELATLAAPATVHLPTRRQAERLRHLVYAYARALERTLAKPSIKRTTPAATLTLWQQRLSSIRGCKFSLRPAASYAGPLDRWGLPTSPDAPTDLIITPRHLPPEAADAAAALSAVRAAKAALAPPAPSPEGTAPNSPVAGGDQWDPLTDDDSPYANPFSGPSGPTETKKT